MSKKKLNLAPVQDMSELLEIKSKKDNVTFVPLDFSSLLFCKTKKLNYIEPKDFLNNCSFSSIVILIFSALLIFVINLIPLFLKALFNLITMLFLSL